VCVCVWTTLYISSAVYFLTDDRTKIDAFSNKHRDMNIGKKKILYLSISHFSIHVVCVCVCVPAQSPPPPSIKKQREKCSIYVATVFCGVCFISFVSFFTTIAVEE